MKKPFDAVKFQRERRTQLSRKLAAMSPEEILKYFRSRRSSAKPTKKAKRATSA
jgi:hypothetical protein